MSQSPGTESRYRGWRVDPQDQMEGIGSHVGIIITMILLLIIIIMVPSYRILIKQANEYKTLETEPSTQKTLAIIIFTH